VSDWEIEGKAWNLPRGEGHTPSHIAGDLEGGHRGSRKALTAVALRDEHSNAFGALHMRRYRQRWPPDGAKDFLNFRSNDGARGLGPYVWLNLPPGGPCRR
jgi:hypothetical protein